MTLGEVATATEARPPQPPQARRFRRLLVMSCLVALGTVSLLGVVSGAEVVGGALLALGSFSWAYHMWRRFRQGMHHDVIAATGGPDAPRVLYLRSFLNDDQPVLLVSTLLVIGNIRKLITHPIAGYLRRFWLLYTARVTWEQMLRVAARPVGPVVAIGEPGEHAPTLGLTNEYVGDDVWMDRVPVLVEASDLVVLRASVTDSVLFEIETSVARLRADQLLIYVGNRSRKLRDRLPRQRQRFYAEFAERANHLFPAGLPAEIGRRHFIRFDDDWSPVVHRRKRFRRDRPPAIHVADYMEAVL